MKFIVMQMMNPFYNHRSVANFTHIYILQVLPFLGTPRAPEKLYMFYLKKLVNLMRHFETFSTFSAFINKHFREKKNGLSFLGITFD